MRAILPWVAVVAVAVLAQVAVGPLVGHYWTKILMDVGIAVLLAVSLNIVNGFTGQFSIGHAGFMAVGGYTAGILTYYGGAALFDLSPGAMAPGAAGHAWFAFSTLVGGIVAAAAGVVVGLPSLRLRGDYLAIVTLGFGEIMRVLLTRTEDVIDSAEELATAPWTTQLVSTGGSLGFTGLPFYTNLFWTWMWTGIAVIVAYRLKESSTGRAMLSVREDEVASGAMGVRTTDVKVTAFALAALFAGIAGGLFAHEIGTTLNPAELGFQKSFEVVIMVVLGGMGSVTGAALAATILTIVPELLREFSEYRMIVYAALLVVVMLVRPTGLLGHREIWHAWRRP